MINDDPIPLEEMPEPTPLEAPVVQESAAAEEEEA